VLEDPLKANRVRTDANGLLMITADDPCEQYLIVAGCPSPTPYAS